MRAKQKRNDQRRVTKSKKKKLFKKVLAYKQFSERNSKCRSMK